MQTRVKIMVCFLLQDYASRQMAQLVPHLSFLFSHNCSWYQDETLRKKLRPNL